jgi:hypothetical protein
MCICLFTYAHAHTRKPAREGIIDLKGKRVRATIRELRIDQIIVISEIETTDSWKGGRGSRLIRMHTGRLFVLDT